MTDLERTAARWFALTGGELEARLFPGFVALHLWSDTILPSRMPGRTYTGADIAEALVRLDAVLREVEGAE